MDRQKLLKKKRAIIQFLNKNELKQEELGIYTLCEKTSGTTVNVISDVFAIQKTNL